MQVATERPMVAGVGISNPQRPLFPRDRITKMDLARYYEKIADRI
jgi:bifunctional non-homologous end joining protein LigD